MAFNRNGVCLAIVGLGALALAVGFAVCLRSAAPHDHAERRNRLPGNAVVVLVFRDQRTNAVTQRIPGWCDEVRADAQIVVRAQAIVQRSQGTVRWELTGLLSGPDADIGEVALVEVADLRDLEIICK